MNLPSPLAGEGDSPLGERGEGCLPLHKHARTMRKKPTEAERRLWTMLRNHYFSTFKFRRQVPIGPFIADFLCYDARLIVEADGGQHAENTYDERRTTWLEQQDFRVLRFWNHEILTQRRDVMDRLYTALSFPSPRSAKSPSRPLPQGEREESAPDV
jgi:very-short-patch-repair endonuclease